jgi:hypothetical protein
MLDELHIQLIPAYSPQAKGRENDNLKVSHFSQEVIIEK